ncbi:RagB/SusD family nutrient uptake outer membrane protein [Chitinophaga sp. LS1]|uniref:RagB/SusD family nutrient uptake outer membrane protein n=1 Tax=Chitinophaga sp. LS1 TaxID=3051176 RepID=UPI002AAB06BD|nr:RagB/SusD family nutrient uptake outer membrane protein [Chitinophaga sp. LS1]WPV67849.1 RagB/SusD family nutrient uptake outer membrane protein [Chitinophaga sp. LS1]
MNSIYRLAIYLNIIGLLLTISFTNCNKFVEVDTPVSYTSGDDAYQTNANAIAVLNGIYASMSSKTIPNGGSINSFMSFYPGLSADEFTLYSGVTNQNYIAFYHNELLNSSGPNVWTTCYPYIFQLNSAIEGISASKGLSKAVKDELLGEAKFLRAFNYFYLVNLYGPVPLAITSDYKINMLLSRSDTSKVYQQIVADLQDASGLLNSNFVGKDAISVSTERTVPNKWAAKALLARVFLYRKDYGNAVVLSTEVINNTSLFSLTDLTDVFLKNSKEAIWQIQPVNLGWNTEDGKLFVIPRTGPSDNNPVYLSYQLLNSIENNDLRFTNWIDTITVGGILYRYPFKYKNATLNNSVTEYQMMLRLAEQYLIRSEANAQLNNFSASISDLNIIRNRAGLPNYEGTNSQQILLDSIMHERQVELFTEMGHRWMDLKRTGAVNNVMSDIAVNKGGVWSSNDQYYPISTLELQYGPNLVQNEGY